MIEEILPNFYKIEVPLPKNPLKVLNSYLVKGHGRNLLIDTGFNREESKKALFAGLEALDVTLEETDIFITHLHADHSGNVSSVATEESVVYCGEIDAKIVNATHTTAYWSELGSVFSLNGFPLEDLHETIRRHPGNRFNPDRDHVFTIVRENDVIEVGDYHFICLETPGHTPAHVCLYEPKNKILISGDHVLDDITPNITIELGLPDPLGHYLKSLEKIDQMDISLVLPGHRRFIDNIHKRIEELKHHHENRLNEVLDILSTGQKDAYQTASKMTWDIAITSWEQFPLAQKWFAAGEAISHLEYLWHIDKVRKVENEGKVLFELV